MLMSHWQRETTKSHIKALVYRPVEMLPLSEHFDQFVLEYHTLCLAVIIGRGQWLAVFSYGWHR